jgi:hypothetical protein
MTRFGYTLMTEQSGPKDLVRYAVSAERVGFDFEMLTLPVDELTGEQLTDDQDGLAQHFLAPGHGRPALADDVFVEVLTAAEPERETAVGEDL